jgi:hypothetical protein
MLRYRCHFLTSDGKIFCNEDITAETTEEALQKVRLRFAETQRFPAFELWLGTTPVYSVMQQAKAG